MNSFFPFKAEKNTFIFSFLWVNKILHTVLCYCILVRAKKLSITLYVLTCFMNLTAHPTLADLVFYGFSVLIFLFRFKVHRELLRILTFHPASVNIAVVYFHYKLIHSHFKDVVCVEVSFVRSWQNLILRPKATFISGNAWRVLLSFWSWGVSAKLKRFRKSCFWRLRCSCSYRHKTSNVHRLNILKSEFSSTFPPTPLLQPPFPPLCTQTILHFSSR